MGRKLKDLTGKRFGRLTVISKVEDYISPKGHPIAQWLCKCDCGNTTTVLGHSLRSGHTTSCGCNIYKQNGLQAQYRRIYKIWTQMKQRCYNTKHQAYNFYGGRGITICNDWLEFSNFVEWTLSSNYTEELTIDRIDVNGNYEPSNCRWTTMKEQCNNRRSNHLITYKGETLTVSLMAEEHNIPYYTLYQRINKYGWTIEKAIETPVRHKKKY